MDFDISYEKIAFSGQKNMPSYGATHKFKIVKPHVDYTVQPGDTLQGISLKHNITMDELKRLNNIWTNDSLFINRIIKIPLSKSDGANLFKNSEHKLFPNIHDKFDNSNGNPKIYLQNTISESPSATTPLSLSPNTRVPPHPLSQEYATYYEALTPSLLGPELNRLSNNPNQNLSRASSHNPLITAGMPQNKLSGLHSSNSTPNTACRKSPRVAIKNGYLKAILPNSESLSRTNSATSNDFEDPYAHAEMIEL